MSNELLEVVRNIDSIVIKVFDDRVEVSGSKVASLRYDDIRSVRLGKGPIPKLTIKDRTGSTIDAMVWRDDGLRARRSIETQRRKLKQLREVGFASLEDFEARAAELGKRLRTR